MMRLAQVTLDRDMRRPENTNAMTRAFRAADGYTISVEGGLVLVSHFREPNMVRVSSATWIVDGEVLVEAAPGKEGKR
jgi:hypothetical protein